MQRKYLSLLLISGVLSGLVAPSALAEESGTPGTEIKSDLPPDPGAVTTPRGGLPSEPATGAATTTVPAGDSNLPTEPSSASEVKPVVKSSSGGVKPGLLEAERSSMLANINAAEELGVGVQGYMAAFKFMEEEVAGGADEATVQKRLDSLRRGLTEQLERKQYLKEKPTAAAQPQSQSTSGLPNILMPAQEIPQSLRFGGAGGSLASPELAKELSAKYGNKLPPGVTQDSLKSQWQNPQTREMVKEKLKSNPAAMELLKQFLNK